MQWECGEQALSSSTPLARQQLQQQQQRQLQQQQQRQLQQRQSSSAPLARRRRPAAGQLPFARSARNIAAMHVADDCDVQHASLKTSMAWRGGLTEVLHEREWLRWPTKNGLVCSTAVGQYHAAQQGENRDQRCITPVASRCITLHHTPS